MTLLSHLSDEEFVCVRACARAHACVRVCPVVMCGVAHVCATVSFPPTPPLRILNLSGVPNKLTTLYFEILLDSVLLSPLTTPTPSFNPLLLSCGLSLWQSYRAPETSCCLANLLLSLSLSSLLSGDREEIRDGEEMSSENTQAF